MPIFEYVCQQCNHQFETIVMGSKKAACPKCESKRLKQQLSSFAVHGEKIAASPAFPPALADHVETLVGPAPAP